MPVIAGRPVLVTSGTLGSTTAEVGSEVAVPDVKPVLLAVTRTRNALPTSAPVTV